MDESVRFEAPIGGLTNRVSLDCVNVAWLLYICGKELLVVGVFHEFVE